VVRSRYLRLSEFDPAPINEVFKQLEKEARTVVEAAAPGVPLLQQRAAHMRYVGQGHEVVAPVPVRALEAEDHVTLQAAFDQAYLALYGRLIPSLDVEVLSWGLKLSSKAEPVSAVEEVRDRPVVEPVARHRVFDAATAGTIEIPLYWRPDLSPGALIDGPALIAEDDTTILVPRGFGARVDARGYVILSRPPVEASR
jgi:N-methylhydantoinase A